MSVLDNTRKFILVSFLLLAGMIAAVLMRPDTLRAQFSAQGTWIASGNVSGTNSVVLVGLPISSLSDILGVPIRFFPAHTNAAGGTTIQVNSLAAVAVTRFSATSGTTGVAGLVPIAGGDLSTSMFSEVVYDGTEFVEKNPATGNVPVGSEIVLTGSNAPAGYLVENGVCVSETTYAALWAFYGSSDIWANGSTGGACSAGSFHLKFANGRTSVASNTQGSQTGPLTGCTAGVGNTCGSQTIAQAQLPNVNFSVTGTASVSATIFANQNYVIPGSGTANGQFYWSGNGTQSLASSGSISGSAASGGSGTAFVPLINQNTFAVKY